MQWHPAQDEGGPGGRAGRQGTRVLENLFIGVTV